MLDLGRSLGFSVAELDEFTVGMVYDAVIYRLNQQAESGDDVGIIASANQTNYDLF